MSNSRTSPRLVTALFAALSALVPIGAHAQKALVYCPPAENANCGTLVTTLSASGGYPGGVERAYDGTGGSVDLRTADLFVYTVFVVPSLADGAAGTPYALLRDATVAARLREALAGRRAMWSGTPDMGATNRDRKNALITNLAAWAGANYGTVRGPGLVVLQDNSEEESRQYDWVKGIIGITVTSDWDPKTYASVRTTTAAGNAILTHNGAALAYENMASYGFYFPEGAPGLSLDAIGQTGTAVGGEVVLVTSEGANTGGAAVKTDKNDYAPGTTVIMSGTGFGAGETVRLTLHEDPLVHADRSFTATADADGTFSFTGFVPEEHHVGVRFILTATGLISGRRAQTTFTDANAFTVTVSPSSVTASSTNTFTFQWHADNSANASTTSLTIPAGWTAPKVGAGAGQITVMSGTCAVSLASIVNNVVTINQQPCGNKSETFTLTYAAAVAQPTVGNAAFLVAGSTSVVVGVTAQVTRSTTTTLTLTTGSTPSVYGSSVTFAATIGATGGFTSGTGTVTFMSGAQTLCANVAVVGTTASCTPSNAVFQAGTYSVVAEYTGATAGGVAFQNSSSAVLAHTVSAKALTVTGVTAGNRTYDGTTAATLDTDLAVLNGVVAGETITLVKTGVTGAFASKLVANGKTVTVTGFTISGTGTANYELQQPTATANITAKALTGSFTAANKEYDGTASASITLDDLSGVIAPDVVVLQAGTATFGNAGAGAGTVTASLSLSGADAANYTVNAIATASATILARPVAVTADAKSRGYGDLDPSFTYQVTSGTVVAGDGFAGALTRAPGDGVGTYAIQQGTLSLGNNYALSFTGALLTIGPRAITVTADAKTRAYGAPDSALTFQLTAGTLVGEDNLTGTLARAPGESVAGSPYAITQGTLTAGTNYTLTFVPAALTITPRSIAIGSVTVANKEYDALTSATITARTLGDGVVTGDDVSLAGGSAAFADKHVGTNKSVSVTGLSLAGGASANYALAGGTFAATASISAKGATVGITAADKVYDGNATAVVTASAPALIAGDQVTVGTANPHFDSKNVGPNKAVVSDVSLGGTDAGNYALTATTASTTASITAKPVTATATAADKEYDGNTSATATPGTITGTVAGDDLAVSTGTATFDSQAAGTGKTVTIAVSLTGTDAGNYTVTTPVTATADITRRSVTGSVTSSNKVYDGATAASIATRSLANTVGGDDVALIGGTASFVDPNVGSGKTVNVTGLAISGAAAGNYTLSATTATATASITERQITAALTAQDRIYDGTTTAQATAVAVGVLGADAVSVSVGDASFATKTAGTGKTVTATVALAGTGAGNYVLASTTVTDLADITHKPLTGSFTAGNKTYDGNTTATVATRSLPGVVGGDGVTLDVSATFDTKDVGTNKTVNGALSITGADAANYTVNATATTQANIEPRQITVTAYAQTKVYGDADPALTYQLTTGTLVAGEGFTGALSRAPGTNVGSYPIGQNTLTAGTNYALTFVGASLAVTARPVTITVNDKSKVYGSADPALTYAITAGNLIAPDGFTGELARAAGTTVTGSPYAINQGTVTLGANYALTVVPGTLTITPKPVAPGVITVADKVYDAGVAATITARALPEGAKVGTDDVALSGGVATFAAKTVGTANAVSITGLALTGTAAGNYDLQPTTASATAAITPATLTPAITAANKVYDGNTSASITSRTLGGVLLSDVVSLTGGTATFADENAADGTVVTGTGFTLEGADAGNYVMLPTTITATATTTANITRKPITGTASAAPKTYDGNTTAVPSVGTLTGVVGTDAVTLEVGTATFDNKNVGNGKTVTIAVSISGGKAGNYTITTPVMATADITQRDVTGTITASDRTYDATTSAAIATRSLGNTIAGDAVNLVGGTATFADKNVGTGKTVTATGLSLTGGDAGNYHLVASTLTTTASIGALQISAAATAQNKTYDGLTTAQAAVMLTGKLGSDVLGTNITSADFADRNAGTNKTVTVSVTLTGDDAGNYTLASYAPTDLADILPKALAGSFTASDKTYDGNPTATVTLQDLPGVINGDNVTLLASGATFDNANFGDRTVTANLSLGGTHATNYTVNTTATAAAKILKRMVTATADAKTKVYGGAEPPLTYQITSGSLVTGESFAGAIARATGEMVAGSPYSIGQGSLALSTNYELTFVPAAFTITQRPVTITADAKTKVYGSDDPALTYTITAGTLVTGDGFTGTLSRSAGETVVGSPYAIQQNNVTLGDNYALSYTGANLTITRKPVAPGVITVADKVYDAGVAATITARALPEGAKVGDDVALSGGVATFAAKTVGTANAVSVTGLALAGTAAGNYDLQPTTASATAAITPATLTPAITAANKVYDGNTSASITSRTLGGVLLSDVVTLTGGTATFADQNAADGTVVTGTGFALEGADAGNYVMLPTTITATATTTANITRKPITVTADAKTKIEGGVDPALTYKTTSGALVAGESYTGALSRVAGETAAGSPYQIQQGTLALSNNYALTYVPANLVVAPNAMPVLGALVLKSGTSVLAGPIAKGTTVSLATAFTDVDSTESRDYTVTVNWDDGSLPETVTFTNPDSVKLTHTYTAANVATIKVTVTDKINTTATGSMIAIAPAYVVIYDPDAGFVTGGGWIESPPNACTLTTACANATGKASFGFVAKYKRGQSVPDGNTEFQFQAGGLSFKSTSYQWLVVAGERSQFKGTGTVNGAAGHTFLITAIDGEIKGKALDAFRIKIVNASGVTIYDNKMGASEDSPDATSLGGGSIQIHDK